jgi:hypothetical protein
MEYRFLTDWPNTAQITEIKGENRNHPGSARDRYIDLTPKL